MSDPFGLMQFAECEHKQLKCEKCGARSDIRGWSTFTGQNKELFDLREENDTLTARLAEAELLWQTAIDNEGTDWANDIIEAAKGGRDEPEKR